MEDEDGRPQRPRSTELLAARRKFWRAFPVLVDQLIKGATEGNVTLLKMLFELNGLEKGAMAMRPGKGRQDKPLETILLEEWARQREQGMTTNTAADGGEDGV